MSQSPPESEKTPAVWWYFFCLMILFVGGLRLAQGKEKASFFQLQSYAPTQTIYASVRTAEAVPSVCVPAPIAQNGRKVSSN